MSNWFETWTWPRTGDELPPEEKPFWDITALARRALYRVTIPNGPPEKLLLALVAEGSATCEQLELALDSLGKKIRKPSLLCLKAVCGHVATDTIQILRLGNTDIRLAHFPTTFFLAVHPPTAPADPQTGELQKAEGACKIVPFPPQFADIFPDPERMLMALENEADSEDQAPPPFCRMDFLAMAHGLPAGTPAGWWAHLGEGRSVWSPEAQDLTVKISIIGQVVRTLAIQNQFHQEFSILL